MLRIVFLALLFATAVLAVDVAGRWWGEVVAEGQSQPIYVTLIQEGATVRGSGGPAPTSQDLLTNGKVQGARITFDIVPGRRTPMHFDLINDGEWLRGTVKVQHDGKTVTGKVQLRKRTT
jgi:hypothetical protein